MSWFRKHPSAPTIPADASSHAVLSQRLHRSRSSWGQQLRTLLFGQKQLDPSILSALEHTLLLADFGTAMTALILTDLTQALSRSALDQPETALTLLKTQLIARLAPVCPPFSIRPEGMSSMPYVILMVGVNGVGKTTTIAKLARQYQRDQHRVMLAAGDTFRAAAVEQLQAWGSRYAMPVIAQSIGADSASVIFDAYQAAKARGMDVLLADTAGRLHTQHHLMDELKKIKRVLQKIDPSLPHDVFLVLDASVGQNAVKQVQQFHEAMHVTGLILTKLDGTAKGGILFALAEQFSIPVRYIGTGEAVEDLQPLDATVFVEAIFDDH